MSTKFLDLLCDYESGLDTAGSHEAMYFEGWIDDLNKGRLSPMQVFREIEDRYNAHNKDVVEEFRAVIDVGDT